MFFRKVSAALYRVPGANSTPCPLDRSWKLQPRHVPAQQAPLKGQSSRNRFPHRRLFRKAQLPCSLPNRRWRVSGAIFQHLRHRSRLRNANPRLPTRIRRRRPEDRRVATDSRTPGCSRSPPTSVWLSVHKASKLCYRTHRRGIRRSCSVCLPADFRNACFTLSTCRGSSFNLDEGTPSSARSWWDLVAESIDQSYLR